jgi:Fe-S cluster biogenesis protein NfuA
VAGEKEFREKMQQLGKLVAELDQFPAGGSKVAARELVQLLMEVHGAGLERIMEIVFASGAAGEAIIDKLGRDPVVRNLLLLYSLHPDDLESRILQAMEKAGARLHKYGAEVELVSIRDGSVELRVRTPSHGCGSTARNLQSLLEESIYEIAPDVSSLSISGLNDERASGFVPLESLFAGLAAHAERGGGD